MGHLGATEVEDTMARDDFDSVLAARTPAEFGLEVVRFAEALGFETVSATVVVDRLCSASEFRTVHNSPREWSGFFDMHRNRRDPVMQHCKRASTLLVWDQSTYVSAGCGDMWEEQAYFGYRCGIAIAIHLPRGRHFFLGVDRERPMPNKSTELNRLLEAFALFTLRAQAASAVIDEPYVDIAETPLTPREREVLLWTAEGKTAWEVGKLLGISERTAAIHANNATRKLGCVSKHHAASRALRHGLIGESADIGLSRIVWGQGPID